MNLSLVDLKTQSQIQFLNCFFFMSQYITNQDSELLQEMIFLGILEVKIAKKSGAQCLCSCNSIKKLTRSPGNTSIKCQCGKRLQPSVTQTIFISKTELKKFFWIAGFKSRDPMIESLFR